MSHNFKPGDLALIVNSRVSPELIGSTVTLVRYLGTADGIEFEPGRNVHNPQGNPMWHVQLLSGSYRTINGQMCDTGPIREQWLMPLLGDFAPAEQKSKAVPA